MAHTDKSREVRVQAAGGMAKSLQQYEELRRGGQVESAVILANLTGGRFHILGQGMALDDMAQAVMTAAHALTTAAEKQPSAVRGGPAPAPREQTPEDRVAAQFQPRPLAQPKPYTGEPGGAMNKGWRGFAEQVLPPDVEAEQVADMRRAFYAGALVAQQAVAAHLHPGAPPTEADVARLARLEAELAAFAQAATEGRT